MKLPRRTEPVDRRIRRTRAALFTAAVRVVGERGTTEVSVTELAEAADVSRRVLYQHFGDRDSLLVAATVDLIAQNDFSELIQDPAEPDSAVALARRFADNRSFFRAVLTGSCAYAVTRTVAELVRPHSVASARRRFADIDDRLAGDIADYFTGGTIMALTRWLCEGPDPLDPKSFVASLVRVQDAISHPA